MVSANKSSGPIYGGDDPLAGLIGEAPAFKRVLEKIQAIATCDDPVLITGETGTGKDLVANAIYQLSRRNKRPFVAVNCCEPEESLIDDELFGHEPGAFTGAQEERLGLIAQADGGTLFLDEIDSLYLRGQGKLLRVLQNGRFRRLGSDIEQRADVRVIAATNAVIEDCVRARMFRKDLFYRLNVQRIQMPTLSERREDIVPLAYHFLRKHGRPGQELLTFTPGAEALLVSLEWPGNVRDLESVVRRVLPFATHELIDVADVEAQLATALPAATDAFPLSFQEHRTRSEREYLVRLLTRHHGNLHSAAREAGMRRAPLRTLLKRHGLHHDDFCREHPGRRGKPRGTI